MEGLESNLIYDLTLHKCLKYLLFVEGKIDDIKY